MPYCRNCGAQLQEGATYCPNCGTAIAPVEAARLETKLTLASWGERFLAWLLDMIIIGAPLLLIRWFTNWAPWDIFFSATSFLTWIPFFFWSLDSVILFLYWTFTEGLYGQSLGKMIMNLKVVHLNGKAPDIVYTGIESIGKAFILPIDCIVGWIVYGSKRQRLFNYVSETIVVKARR